MSVRISIIEDHEIFRTALANLIRDRDDLEIEVLAAHGKDYFDQLEGAAPSDIVILDFEMPVMDGPETAHEIRKRFGEHVKILALSIHKEHRLVNEMLNAGANGFISKDASSDELFLAIRSILEYDHYISPSVSEHLYKKKDGHLSVYEDPLSEKEGEMLKLICEQKTNKQIADLLNISTHSANTYRNRILQKTGMKNTAGLVVYAIQEGIYRV